MGVASRLLSETKVTNLCMRPLSNTPGFARHGKANRQVSCSTWMRRANYYDAFLSDKPAPPLQPGLHVFDEWDLAELREYIDWTPFFRAWELHGNYPAILDDDVVGEAARQLKVDADAMLDDWLKKNG